MPLLSFALLTALNLIVNPNDGQAPERTVFQTGSPYSDRIDLGADVAIVYGFGNDMPQRVKSWRDKGYSIHLMTGVAWGQYQDYYFGRWDGIDHQDEAQTRDNGEKIGHGGDVYYMSPGPNYGKYLAEGVRKAMDAGVEAVHLEEPEFWSWGGYGGGFKKEWRQYYGEDWQDPESSPDARWRAAKLMYYLYRRALQQVFDSIQDYNKAHGTHVRCYVPTHSLLNYASWGIVSPESSLARLKGCDGYIAQVWTGTARTPNNYQGVQKERTFETAFLEYGAMQNLVRSTGRSVWYLADPVEDNADHDWGDYRRNYHSTLLASLLQPEVAQYEIMPWPERVFTGKYPAETPTGLLSANDSAANSQAGPLSRSEANSAVENSSGHRGPTELAAVLRADSLSRHAGEGGEGVTITAREATLISGPRGQKARVGIPDAYATELQVVINALKDMKQRRVRWNSAGAGVGFLVSDSLMFERGGPDWSDRDMGHVYGLAMPFVKRAIPIQPVQLENVGLKGYLKDFKLLLMTYEGMKPLSPDVHQALADWVRAGGTLAFVDDDSDPFLKVREWWNTAPMSFATPREHLFSLLGVGADPQGIAAPLPDGSDAHRPLTELAAVSQLGPLSRSEADAGEGGVGAAINASRSDSFESGKPCTGATNSFDPPDGVYAIGKGRLIYMKKSPTALSMDPKGGDWLIDQIRQTMPSFPWKESSSFVLERGPYVIASGMDESTAPPTELHGAYVDLFDPTLSVVHDITLGPDSRHFLIDLSKFKGAVVASAGKVVPVFSDDHQWSGTIEGIAQTNGLLLLRIPRAPTSATLDAQPLDASAYDPSTHLLWLKFPNTASPHTIQVSF